MKQRLLFQYNGFYKTNETNNVFVSSVNAWVREQTFVHFQQRTRIHMRAGISWGLRFGGSLSPKWQQALMIMRYFHMCSWTLGLTRVGIKMAAFGLRCGCANSVTFATKGTLRNEDCTRKLRFEASREHYNRIQKTFHKIMWIDR